MRLIYDKKIFPVPFKIGSKFIPDLFRENLKKSSLK